MGYLLQRVHLGSGAHPTSYSIGTRKKWPGRGRWPLTSTNVQVNDTSSYISTAHLSLWHGA